MMMRSWLWDIVGDIVEYTNGIYNINLAMYDRSGSSVIVHWNQAIMGWFPFKTPSFLSDVTGWEMCFDWVGRCVSSVTLDENDTMGTEKLLRSSLWNKESFMIELDTELNIELDTELDTELDIELEKIR